MMTGERFSAAEAYRLGVVDHIAPADQLMLQALKFGGVPGGQSAHRPRADQGSGEPRQRRHAARRAGTGIAIVWPGDGDDGSHGGHDRVLEKRKPVWTGRVAQETDALMMGQPDRSRLSSRTKTRPIRTISNGRCITWTTRQPLNMTWYRGRRVLRPDLYRPATRCPGWAKSFSPAPSRWSPVACSSPGPRWRGWGCAWACAAGSATIPSASSRSLLRTRRACPLPWCSAAPARCRP